MWSARRRCTYAVTVGRRASLLIVVAALVAATLAVTWRHVPGAAAANIAAGDSPPGFWYGSDSTGMHVPGSGPYKEPVIGGYYGGYMGMVGSWSVMRHCQGASLVWSKGNSIRADRNFTKYHKGVGTGAYWFMGGPGVDPHYNGTTQEAKRWGARQAAGALANIRRRPFPQRVLYPVLWMDIELPGIPPARDNGWVSVYTSPCSGKVRQNFVRHALDRADFDGFWGYVHTHSTYALGVYSAPRPWARMFGTGRASLIPHTYEWTYQPETANLSYAPRGWCYRRISGCAEFFGGMSRSSKYALAWQFSGGGGVRNAYGDFDQINASVVR